MGAIKEVVSDTLCELQRSLILPRSDDNAEAYGQTRGQSYLSFAFSPLSSPLSRFAGRRSVSSRERIHRNLESDSSSSSEHSDGEDSDESFPDVARMTDAELNALWGPEVMPIPFLLTMFY